MTDIDVDAKTDRELLLLIVGKVNTIGDQTTKLTAWKDGNGMPGAQFQLRIMWICFVAIVAKIWNNR